jgi:hypothetical protein
MFGSVVLDLVGIRRHGLVYTTVFYVTNMDSLNLLNALTMNNINVK